MMGFSFQQHVTSIYVTMMLSWHMHIR